MAAITKAARQTVRKIQQVAEDVKKATTAILESPDKETVIAQSKLLLPVYLLLGIVFMLGKRFIKVLSFLAGFCLGVFLSQALFSILSFGNDHLEVISHFIAGLTVAFLAFQVTILTGFVIAALGGYILGKTFLPILVVNAIAQMCSAQVNRVKVLVELLPAFLAILTCIFYSDLAIMLASSFVGAVMLALAADVILDRNLRNSLFEIPSMQNVLTLPDRIIMYGLILMFFLAGLTLQMFVLNTDEETDYDA